MPRIWDDESNTWRERSTFGCKTCGSDEIGSRERLVGLAQGILSEDGKRIEHTGYTEVDYDSSETVGYECGSCGEQADTLSELVAEVEDDDES